LSGSRKKGAVAPAQEAVYGTTSTTGAAEA